MLRVGFMELITIFPMVGSDGFYLDELTITIMYSNFERRYFCVITFSGCSV